MGLRRRLEASLGLGWSADVRRVTVGRRVAVAERPLQSTPGARVRIGRSAEAPELQLAVLWCHRRGLPMELVEDGSGLRLDGEPIDLEELVIRLSG